MKAVLSTRSTSASPGACAKQLLATTSSNKVRWIFIDHLPCLKMLTHLTVKFFTNAAIGRFQRLGIYPGFTDYAHEIGVGDPARQDVHVDVTGHSSSCGLTKVHSQIEAIRMI